MIFFDKCVCLRRNGKHNLKTIVKYSSKTDSKTSLMDSTRKSSRHSSSSKEEYKRYSSSSRSSTRTETTEAQKSSLPSKRKAEETDLVQKLKKKTVECRRSTAAQFFVEEETVQESVTADRIVQLLNDAVTPKEENGKLKNLLIVKELIIQKEPKLLDNFLDEVVSFQHDTDPEVRRFIVQFIEDVCRRDLQFLPKVINNLLMMLHDESVKVQKKVIQTTTHLYPLTIRYFVNAKHVDDVMEAIWASMTELKLTIVSLLESDNEGVRTSATKFMEHVILAQTFKDQYADPKNTDLSLDEIPVILKVFRPRKMEEEAKDIFQRIVAFHCASHVSLCNLMACMQVLTSIGRQRFEFFPKVLEAFELLHANLPPTLGQSQVSSVRKNLKLELFQLVKHPGAVEFQSRISIMLSDLGASPQQISRCFPDAEAIKKPSVKIEDRSAKQEDIPSSSRPRKIKSSLEKGTKAKNTAIDITAEDLVPKFHSINVVDLVLVSMLSLPDVMPTNFQSTYTPIAAAGTEAQIKHLARLLATQLTLAGIGKGVEQMKHKMENEKVESDEDEAASNVPKPIQTLVSQTTEMKPKKQGLVLMPSGGSQIKANRISKKIDFQAIAKSMNEEESNNFCRAAYNRILNAEKMITKRGAAPIRTKLLTNLATRFRGDFSIDLKNHIMENPRNRLDLAFSWIYQEYSAYRGFECSIESHVENYEEAVDSLLGGILKSDEENHALYTRFFLDVPFITEGMAESLKTVCIDESSTAEALEMAESMSFRRPTKKLLFLGVICDLTLHENCDIRTKAVKAAVDIHESGHMRSFIEAFALRSLKFLLHTDPPTDFFLFFKQRPVTWSEDLTKVCLHLYLTLLPINHRLIQDLGTVYVEATGDIKRIILRALEAPVKGMSMASPELLLFVENCPKGAETLITRIIHILTDKAPPSAELVARVRDLYRKRVPDVRFFIPIINGLSKREIISALPELIQQKTPVVKEVLHRLLGSNFSSPISPAELLVALHNIDPSKCNLKIIIKATSLCLEEKNVYTQVVLAMVIQELMEQTPLPILLMRTVIQSLANYPHLLDFVTHILQRLILKEVWKQKKIWEGFIKCCQRTKPKSFQVLLQLPAPQLEEVLSSCPDLRESLCLHVKSFNEGQKANIPKAVIDVLGVDLSQDDKKSEDGSIKNDEENIKEPLPPGQDHL
ncbi:symplekin isoform X2 [Parasteatoda tepidariorum]|uniref:symplekin isoform X2 n=1 Tax=Parasteatoda tepidariorum TaxID=114398 RepID=UPI0039BC7A39